MYDNYHNGQNYPSSFNSSRQANLPAPGLPPSLHHPNPNTLPPLDPSNLNSIYHNSASQAPLSATSANTSAVNQNGSYAVYAPTGNLYLNTPSYSQPSSNQQSPHTTRPSSTHANSQLQTPLYTSAPHQKGLPELAPRTLPEPSVASICHPLNQQASTSNGIAPPTHVVGSQGRRGVLPSLPGRPLADENAVGQKGGPLPPKDAEGKFPCTHCNKTYLHAKHLKRHLLRHTGVRPYTCGLCTDTFSRSDILKRHFIKCSARRGNPSGETHLSHSRRHKKEQAERNNRATPTADQSGTYTPTSTETFDVNTMTALHLDNPPPSHYGPVANGSGHVSGEISRNGSIKNGSGGSGTTSNRTSLGMLTTSGYDSANFSYSTGHATPDSAPASGAATPYTYPHEARNQLSPNGILHSTMNGVGHGLPSNTSAPASSSHVAGSIPYIAGQGHGYHDWNSSSFNHDDYLHGQGGAHSGPEVTQNIKSEQDYSHFQFSGYTTGHF